MFSDNFYLGAGIGFGTGVIFTLLIVGLTILIKHSCCSKKRKSSPKIRQVSPHNIQHTMQLPASRNNSMCGSTISDDSYRHNGGTTPISPNSSLALSLSQSRNGFIKQSNGFAHKNNQSNGHLHTNGLGLRRNSLIQ